VLLTSCSTSCWGCWKACSKVRMLDASPVRCARQEQWQETSAPSGAEQLHNPVPSIFLVIMVHRLCPPCNTVHCKRPVWPCLLLYAAQAVAICSTTSGYLGPCAASPPRRQPGPRGSAAPAQQLQAPQQVHTGASDGAFTAPNQPCMMHAVC